MVATLACTVYPERTILDRFFSASRLRDKTALAEFATVIFEPLEHGIITTFEIRGVSHENSETKALTLAAPVKLPDGQVVQRILRVTLERRAGRWMVTAFQM